MFPGALSYCHALGSRALPLTAALYLSLSWALHTLWDPEVVGLHVPMHCLGLPSLNDRCSNRYTPGLLPLIEASLGVTQTPLQDPDYGTAGKLALFMTCNACPPTGQGLCSSVTWTNNSLNPSISLYGQLE